jgi:hypothetical protein
MLSQLFVVFFSSMHLEVHDVTLVLGDLLLVANENLFGALRNQPHVVRNHEDSSLEAIETTSQGINGLHIKWICLG